jgi:hypothetical protein
MPPPAPAKLPRTSREGAAAVYMPACVNRIFGRPSDDGAGLHLPEAMVSVSARAGLPVWIPEDVSGHCCSVPWTSKGYSEGASLMANRTVEALWRWSGEGELPIVIDASSCALGLASEVADNLTDENRERHGRLDILDSVAWAKRLLPSFRSGRLGSVAVHPTCRPGTWGWSEAAGDRRRDGGRGCPADSRHLLRDGGRPRPPSSRNSPLPPPPRGSRAPRRWARRLPVQQPHLARSACKGTGAAYGVLLIPLERISRA